jgi:4,5-dihydroxyphthalate decarboxylase
MKRLSLGCTLTDRTSPLVTGRVAVPGYELDITLAEPREIFAAALNERRFDICEMSMGSHIEETARGNADYIGVPVFLSRAFRHGSVYVRSDLGIEKPCDLQGRRIGVPDYSQTVGIWIRGILRDHYGVDLSGVEWRVGSLEGTPSTGPIAGASRFERIVSLAPGESLNGLLQSGEIDAVISPRPPGCLYRPGAKVRRLFDPTLESEKAYFRDTGFFPIMHCLAVRKDAVDRDPTLPALLFATFSEAKALAQRELLLTNYSRVSIPWLADHVEGVQSLLGTDPWRYGFQSSLAELTAMTRYAWEDRIADRKVDPSELFHDTTTSDEFQEGKA